MWGAEREQGRRSRPNALTAQLRVDRAGGSPTWTVPIGERARERTVKQFRDAFDRAARRLRRRAEVPAAVGAAVPAARARAAPATPRRATWCCGRCARWRSAACAITSAAASIAIRSTPPGACRTSRRCSTTRPSSCSRSSRARRCPAIRSTREVAEDTLLYVMREMTDAGGGFYSAEDADSVPPEDAGCAAPAQEGRRVLSLARRRARRAARRRRRRRRRCASASSPDGNAPQDPQQEFTGKNLLLRGAVDRRASRSRTAGRRERDRRHPQPRPRDDVPGRSCSRPRPHRDDKILTAWNGLMIARVRAHGARRCAASAPTVAPHGRAVSSKRRAAPRAFIREQMWNAGTRTLLRALSRRPRRDRGLRRGLRVSDRRPARAAFRPTPQPMWLEWAIALQQRQDELFWDEQAGGWFSTTGRDPSVLLRMKEDYDGAEPTASSVSVMNLLVLSHLVEDPSAGPIASSGRCSCSACGSSRSGRGGADDGGGAVDLSRRHAADRDRRGLTGRDPSTRSGSSRAASKDDGSSRASDLVQAIALQYLPFCDSRFTSRQSVLRALGGSLPFIAAMQPVDGASAAYVCRDFTCRQPVTTADALRDRSWRPPS